MTRPTVPPDVFPSASEDANAAARSQKTPLTNAPSYRLAYSDTDFLLRDELRPVRLQLELLKPDLIQEEHGVHSTVVVFGSARIPTPEVAAEKLALAQAAAQAEPDDAALADKLSVARRVQKNSRYYDEAKKLARLITLDHHAEGPCELLVVTGGGPGIMEAANRGAAEAGGKSIGLNIVLPFEQEPNPYITPELCFQFHYFAIRKMHFLKRAKALIACPGGFGTLDELFETLTLIQTKKIKPLPIQLMGKEYWNRVIDFEWLVEEGMISRSDLSLFKVVDSAEEAWSNVKAFWGLQ